jgi:hypothetical protein
MHPAGPFTRVLHGLPFETDGESIMSELSMALGNEGEPHRINHGGKTYRFWLVDQVRKNAIEKRFYQQAREGVYVDREHLDPEQYVAELRRVRESYEAGEYAYFGERGSKLLQTPKGALVLLEVITGETEEALIPLLTARATEVNELLKSVLAESFGSHNVPVVKVDG